MLIEWLTTQDTNIPTYWRPSLPIGNYFYVIMPLTPAKVCNSRFPRNKILTRNKCLCRS